MKYSGIGGQAVLEGIMMKNGDKYAVSVRKPDGEIVTDIQEYHGICEKHAWMNLPFIRGVFRFWESLSVGMKALTYSSSFFEEEETADEKPGFLERMLTKEQLEKLMMTASIVLAVIFSVGIFMLLPAWVGGLLKKIIASDLLVNFLEGILRIALFILYVPLISLMNDIKRTFMYHGSEHKCINCIEHGLPLTVENVRNSSKEHKRCGTSFLLIVMVISILIFMLVRVETIGMRLLSRVILIPVIAGISYEFLRLAGISNSRCMTILSKPGMWLQGLTTKEPDDAMIEVAITAVEAVFDWKEFEESLDPEQRDCSSGNGKGGCR